MTEKQPLTDEQFVCEVALECVSCGYNITGTTESELYMDWLGHECSRPKDVPFLKYTRLTVN